MPIRDNLEPMTPMTKAAETTMKMDAGCDYETVRKNIDEAMKKGCRPQAAVKAALEKAGLKKMPAEGRKDVKVVWMRKDDVGEPGAGGSLSTPMGP